MMLVNQGPAFIPEINQSNSQLSRHLSLQYLNSRLLLQQPLASAALDHAAESGFVKQRRRGRHPAHSKNNHTSMNIGYFGYPAPPKKIEESPASGSKWEEKVTPLGPNFSPGTFDVICARGKQAWNHPGNRYFRSLIEERVERYSKCNTRLERSLLVTEIVESVRIRSNGFVKYDPRISGWIEVGDLLAREKCGQMLRNALGGKYKSSVQAKKVRKTDKGSKLFEDLNQVLFSNSVIRSTMQQTMEMSVKNELSDDEAMELFNRVNLQVLSAIKQDKTLLMQYSNALVQIGKAHDEPKNMDFPGVQRNLDGKGIEGDIIMMS